MWAQTGLSFNGSLARGFGIGSPGDPEIYTKLSTEQQQWVSETLGRLNGLIVSTTGSTCPTWAPEISRASGCFQNWFNTVNASAPIKKLRTDGVFDQDTLDALIVTTQIHSNDFPNPYPSKKKLSTGAMIGIAAAGAVVIGGVIYFVTK
jgi:hypothetical protein